MSGGSSHNKSSFHQIRIRHSLLSDEVKEVLEIVTSNSGTKNWPSKFRVRKKYAPEKNGGVGWPFWNPMVPPHQPTTWVGPICPNFHSSIPLGHPSLSTLEDFVEFLVPKKCHTKGTPNWPTLPSPSFFLLGFRTQEVNDAFHACADPILGIFSIRVAPHQTRKVTLSWQESQGWQKLHLDLFWEIDVLHICFFLS